MAYGGGVSGPEPASPAGAPGVDGCPDFHAAIELIGRRWNGVILQGLLGGPVRFADLTRRIAGITDAMLSQRLKELEAAGLVHRDVRHGPPVEVRYSLTAVGSSLAPVLESIAEWSVTWGSALSEGREEAG